MIAQRTDVNFVQIKVISTVGRSKQRYQKKKRG